MSPYINNAANLRSSPFTAVPSLNTRIAILYWQAASIHPKFFIFSSKFIGLCGWGEPSHVLGSS